MNLYELKDIEDAYRKLKSYAYYDNNFHFLRSSIAEFECSKDFNNKLKILLKSLNNYDDSQEYFDELLKKVRSVIVPKKFIANSHEKDSHIITNRFNSATYNVSNVNYYIDLPIELHIISVLWIINVGYLLEKEPNEDSYANKLNIDGKTNKVKKGNKLFEVYYSQYQKWRDNAIDEAKELLKRKKDVIIISLDIQNYYHSVDLDIINSSELFNELSRDKNYKHYEHLTDLLDKIHSKYKRRLKPFLIESHAGCNSKYFLPIGLLSSGILANWYLKKFDKNINEELNPAYYGRYVDDIMIVLENNRKSRKNKKTIEPFESIIKRYFIDKTKIFEEFLSDNENIEKEKSKKYAINGYKNLFIQEEKIKLYIIDADASKAVIEKFESNIRKNSSEFRFLPQEDRVDSEFIDEAYSLIYSDSINKLRGIEKYRHDKFKASSYLAKQIYIAKLCNRDKNYIEKTKQEILGFFKGRYGLEFCSLWEKIFAYFIITNDRGAFIEFYNEILDSIEKIQLEDICIKRENHARTSTKLRNNLIRHLHISASLSLALNPRFINEYVMTKKLDDEGFDLSILENFKKSNLIRHNYVLTPLLNYTNWAYKSDTLNLLDKNIFNKNEINEINSKSLKLNEHLMKFSPRYVPFHEVTLFVLNKRVNQIKNKDIIDVLNDIDELDSLERPPEERERFNCYEYLEKAVKLFYKLNYEYILETELKDEQLERLKKKYINKEVDNNNDIYSKISLNSNNFNKGSMRIAVANLKVLESNIEASYLKKPRLEHNRLQTIFKLLNLAIEEKTDLIVLPEVSVPHAWLQILADYSKRHRKVIVCGLEHWVNRNNYAYNFLVTIIPYKVDDYDSVLIKVRLKNHYSPEERKLLLGCRCEIPERVNKNLYDLFVWNNLYFACYNCYELADIEHRSIFKSKVDFLTVCEWNRDINHFSNLIESTSRDLHCYLIQVNTSEYGDTRIISPSRTEEKDILKLKGGENSTILVGEIDIKALRRFQFIENDYQERKTFKPTPPSFEKKNNPRLNPKSWLE